MNHKARVKKLLVYLVSSMAITMSSIYGWYKYQFIYLKNFDVVIPNTIYRSGQPSEKNFTKWQNKYHFKSILNLRGREYCKSESESLECNESIRKHGINTRNLGISSKKMPYPEEVKEIISFIQKSPKPLLIHCKHGVDRTGLVSAIAIILNDQPLETALYQISLFKGFLPFRHHEILRVFLYDYENWLFNNKLKSSGKNFSYWVDNVYATKFYPNRYRAMKTLSFLDRDDWPGLLEQLKTA